MSWSTEEYSGRFRSTSFTALMVWYEPWYTSSTAELLVWILSEERSTRYCDVVFPMLIVAALPHRTIWSF